MQNVEFINAGAGSGKTYFLSNKLAEVVSENLCSAEEIILTTFTEVAAAELKNKARETLFKNGNTQQANLLASAAIGTVHSVALQLVQKYWHYLGIGVNLRVMPEEDKDFFLTQSLAFIPTPEELNRLDRITRLFDFQKGIGEKDPDHWKSDLLDIIGKTLNNRISNLNDSLLASINEVERLFPINDDWKLDFNIISNTLPSALQLLRAAAPSAARDRRIRATETLINLNGNYGIGDLLTLQTLLAELPGNISAHLPQRGPILNVLANLHSSPLLINGLREYINLIFDLASRSIDRYSAYKEEHKLIDFNDMEVYLLKLLEIDEARDEISNRYKMVFVDEFQDCSPIQIEIFMKLSDLVQQSYWVGDPKQAIYDFRGTDPLLIDAVINKISEDDEHNLTIGERLSESWRSLPQIVALDNHIFTEALADQVDAHTIPLNPIRTANELPDDNIHKPLQKWGIVDTDHNNITAFNHHTASEIAKLLNCENLTVVDKVKSRYDLDPTRHTIITRPLRAKDIAVLCRTNVRVYELSAALKGFGIQVAAVQENLVETAEMKLFLAILNYYMDNNDSLARATIRFLSEGDFSASHMIDDRLNFLYGPNAHKKPEEPEEENNEGWQAYYQYLSTWGNDNSIIQKMDAIRESSGHLSVSTLVEKLITITGISDLLLLWPNPLQRKNNLQTMKTMAVDFENRCMVMDIPATLLGFMESINYYGNQELKQGAAAGDDAVNVMTYHKSKGLEWPVIILNQLDYNHFSERNLYVQGFFGVNIDTQTPIDINNPHAGKVIVLMPWPYGSLNRNVPADLRNRINVEPRFIRLKDSVGRELKRLLYVGMTRARDKMIFLNFNDKDLNWLNDAIGFDNIQQGQGNFLGTEDEILINNFVYNNIDYPEIEVDTVSILQKNGPADQNSEMFRSPSKATAVDVTVELMVDFDYRIQRMPGANIDDSIVGECLHSLFYSYKPNDQDNFIKSAQRIIVNYGLEGDLTHPEHILQSASNLYSFLTHQFGEPVAIHKELPLQMFDNGVVYNGNADMVWETSDALILVDYKSYSGAIGHVLNPEHDKYSGRYSGQLAKYSNIINHSFQGEKEVQAALIYYPVIGIVVGLNY